MEKWRRSPEWQKQVRQVLALKERGFSEHEICCITKIEDHGSVKRILEDDESCNLLMRKHWEEKIPTIRNIIGMSLHGVEETLKELQDPDVRKAMITNMRDLSLLTKIVTDLNMLLRLEEDKSTQNIAVNKSYAQTRGVLQDLAKVDPVFQYQIAAKEEESKKEDPLGPIDAEKGTE